MPTFEIEQYELHVSKYRVTANNRAEAIAELLAGKAHPVDQSQEFVEVADKYGLAAQDFPELVLELKRLDVPGINDIIRSVRSIDEA